MTTYSYIAPCAPNVDTDNRRTIPAGQAAVLRPRGVLWTLGVSPGTGGTASVEVSVSPTALAPDDMLWHAISPVSSTTDLYVFHGPVSAVRVRAISSPAIVEWLS